MSEEYSHNIAKKLTDEEYDFCEEYIKTCSLKHALENIKYKHKKNKALIYNRELVKKYIRLRREEIKETFLTADDYLLSIQNVIDECMTLKPVLDKNGMGTGEMKKDTDAAIKGLKLMGEAIKVLKPDGLVEKTKIINNVNVDSEDIEEFKQLFNERY